MRLSGQSERRVHHRDHRERRETEGAQAMNAKMAVMMAVAGMMAATGTLPACKSAPEPFSLATNTGLDLAAVRTKFPNIAGSAECAQPKSKRNSVNEEARREYRRRMRAK